MISYRHIGCFCFGLWLLAAVPPARTEDRSTPFPAGDLPATFEQFALHAMRHHPGLEASWTKSQAAQERVGQAGTLPDPQVGVTRFGESVQTRTGPQETVFSLNQSFPWFGTLNRRTDVARAEARAAELAVQSAELLYLREKSNAARGRVHLADLASYPQLMVGATYFQVGDPEVEHAIHQLHEVHGELQNLSIVHFYKMISALPPEKQEKLRAMAVEALSQPE
ncbi:MAG: TolC family protein [Kiritimatiellae bacterium]|jgi:hypothetical protein|nr:TolC family protein [Kiritimatiellia bacterium]